MTDKFGLRKELVEKNCLEKFREEFPTTFINWFRAEEQCCFIFDGKNDLLSNLGWKSRSKSPMNDGRGHVERFELGSRGAYYVYFSKSGIDVPVCIVPPTPYCFIVVTFRLHEKKEQVILTSTGQERGLITTGDSLIILGGETEIQLSYLTDEWYVLRIEYDDLLGGYYELICVGTGHKVSAHFKSKVIRDPTIGATHIGSSGTSEKYLQGDIGGVEIFTGKRPAHNVLNFIRDEHILRVTEP